MNIAAFIMPELFLAFSALFLLVVGAFRGNEATRSVLYLSVFATFVSALMLCLQSVSGTVFGSLFIVDAYARFFKIAILVATLISLVLSDAWLRSNSLARPEFPVLILLAALGMMLMVSSNNFISLYLGLELQSLALYVLAAFKRDSAASSEAGLKYFVLGALSSGLLLYGISLVYGFSGTTSFPELSRILSGTNLELGPIFGLVFICAALCFKISAVPFHMWTPDVYEGSPTPVTAFFAAAPKLAAVALFVRVLFQPFGGMTAEWEQIIFFVSIATMLLGSFAGLKQTNIKRLMAYSSIANIGFILVGVLAGQSGVQAVLIYLAIYFVNSLGVFSVILCLRRQGQSVEKISDLSGLSRSHPFLALAMALFMFSMAGVPPLAGFLGKYFVFLAAVNAGFVPLAIIGMLTSCVAAFYYLRVIKVMYFDSVSEGQIDPVNEFSLKFVGVVATLAVGLFIWPFNPLLTPLIESARQAATSLIIQ